MIYGYLVKSLWIYYLAALGNNRTWYLLMSDSTEPMYLCFSHVNGNDNQNMEILTKPNESINGKSHHLSKIIKNHATMPLALLGEVVESNYITESELKSHPLSYSQKEIQENIHSTYKLQELRQIESQYIMEETYSLKESYMCIFQPKPSLDYYSKGQPHLDRSHLGPLSAHVHAPSGNFLADYLALNSAQFIILQHRISATNNEFHLAYILPTWLPIPGTKLDKAYITLSTVTLSNNVCSIQFPVPYTIFTHYEYPGPFLDHSAVQSGPLVPPPHPGPPPTDSMPSNDTLSPLSLLIQACGLPTHLPPRGGSS